MANYIDPEQKFVAQNLLLTKEVYYAFGSALILYTLKAVSISNNKDRLDVFQENFLFQVLALTATNILGFIIVLGIQIESLLVVLTIMVTIRVTLEIYFSRKMKLI